MPSIIFLFLFGGKHTGGVSGIFKMWLFEWLRWAKNDTSDVAEKTLLKFILNTSLVTWIVCKNITKDDKEVELYIPNATHILTNKTITNGDFCVTMDLENQKVHR